MIKSTKWENEFDLKNNKENEFEKIKIKWIYIKKSQWFNALWIVGQSRSLTVVAVNDHILYWYSQG